MLSRRMIPSCYQTVLLLLSLAGYLPTSSALVAASNYPGMQNSKSQSVAKQEKQSKLLVTHLPSGTLTDEVLQLFETVGEVRHVQFQRIGSALVEMTTPELAEKAIAKLNRTTFRRQIIKVQYPPQAVTHTSSSRIRPTLPVPTSKPQKRQPLYPASH